MRIELLKAVSNAKGRGFQKGDVVDWPRRDALPLVLAGVAREPDPAPLSKPKRRKREEPAAEPVEEA